jgi:PKD domain
MKLSSLQFTVSFLVLLVFNASATPRYVDLNCPNATPPFTNWSTAATNIQDAIDVSADGDSVFVTNGVYAVGGRVMAADLTNRVALNKAVTVQSVNGPFVTVIQGAGATNGTTAVRCAWLTNGAALSGFTLRNGGTRTSGTTATLESGGGVWCASSNAIVANCVIVSNTAYFNGGAAYQGTLNNCFVNGNGISIGFAAGTYGANLNNCTVTSNSYYGTYQGILTNCIVYFNSVANYSGSPTFSYCCTTPLPVGLGNFTNGPQLFVDGIHLSPTSPCIGAGTNLASGPDIFGKLWANPPSVGCSEWQPAPLVTTAKIQLTSDPVGFTVGVAGGNGQSPLAFFWLKDGTVLQDNGHYSSSQTTNLDGIGISFADAGNYQLVVSNAFGVVTSAVAQLVVHCVDVAGANPVAPYSTWATAATNIQDAITVSAAGEIVLVTNGFYAVGGKSMDGVITNRVSVDKAILVQSVNGPSTTIIQGAWDPTSTNGPGAVRCVWLTNNATLSGFTLRGGATRSINASGNQSMNGGGAWAASTNATTANCLITGNFAFNRGGGAYQVALKNCLLSGNHAVGSGTPGAGVAFAGSGGGAANCNLKNCYISSNYADQSNGGGTDNCNLRNCALIKNSSFLNGGGANLGLLINCTVSGNISSGYSSGYGGAVYGATLTNCVVWGNIQRTSYPYTNYASANCVLSYCDTDPLPSGAGNIDIDPQLLGDGVHLTAASPCIGAGPNSVVIGTDIDGQPWNNPPSIGCDEWQPAPVIGMQPSYLVGFPAHGLTFNLVVAGQLPFNYYWSKDGTPVQDDSNHSNSGAANLVVNNFGPDDASNYQVVVSNAFGVVTSAVAQVVIHAVDVVGVNPVPPFSTWATAATNIQDAINIAAAGDIVLVTNGVYATGGKVEAGDLTNRVAVDKPITVTSVNGYAATVIQGAWDPTTTNGPLAVRCAWLADGATLNGFTLQHGATRPFSGFVGAPAESGGGAWCSSTNGVLSNCMLSNNAANYGGGIAFGTLNNSFVINNTGFYSGGGAYLAVLDNCAVLYNYTFQNSIGSFGGGGTFQGTTRNSIVWNNYYMLFGFPNIANYSPPGSQSLYSYCLTSPLVSGAGNLNADPQFLDLIHISSTSPCHGTGSSLYAFGTDIDGEPWANPPSMGCDEVVESALTGPLAVTIQAPQTNSVVNRNLGFWGLISGRVTRLEWSFGDGPTVTNISYNTFHMWTNSGDYTVTFTAYNTDNLAGVSTNLLVHISPFNPPLLQSAVLLTNGFRFQFTGQAGALYTVQFATSLAPPITWQTLQLFSSTGGVHQITDPTAPNATRFYRVKAQ